MTHVNFTATQNSISNSTIYDENTGGTTSTPQNNQWKLECVWYVRF